MRKITALLLCLVLCLGMAACNAFHDHTWSFDAKNHWCDCECGKQIEPLPHNLYENVCVACGVKVFSGPYTGYIESYDEHGSMEIAAEYDLDGNLLWEDRYEWEYDENGNTKRSLKYTNGTLVEETTYKPCLYPGVEVCPKESIEYYENGSRKVWDFNEYGSALSGTVYLADGSMGDQESYEYTYDDRGNQLRRVRYKNGIRIWEMESFLGPDGNLHISAVIYYEDDGSIAFDQIHGYEFDDRGNLRYHSESSGGVIVKESFYELDSFGKAQLARTVAYREDGTKSDEYIYDGQFNQTQHIEYNPDGSIKE